LHPGKGDGPFRAPAAFATGPSPSSVAIAVQDADRRPDLAVANSGSNTVSVLLGNGDGTFGAHTDFGTGSFPHSVAIGDLNGDSRPDMAVAKPDPAAAAEAPDRVAEERKGAVDGGRGGDCSGAAS